MSNGPRHANSGITALYVCCTSCSVLGKEPCSQSQMAWTLNDFTRVNRGYLPHGNGGRRCIVVRWAVSDGWGARCRQRDSWWGYSRGLTGRHRLVKCLSAGSGLPRETVRHR